MPRVLGCRGAALASVSVDVEVVSLSLDLVDKLVGIHASRAVTAARVDQAVRVVTELLIIVSRHRHRVAGVVGSVESAGEAVIVEPAIHVIAAADPAVGTIVDDDELGSDCKDLVACHCRSPAPDSAEHRAAY